jgi:hypothetical protein
MRSGIQGIAAELERLQEDQRPVLEMESPSSPAGGVMRGQNP